MIEAGTMVKYFPEEVVSASGRFEVKHTVMDEEFVKKEKMCAIFGGGESYHEVFDLKPGTYIKLIGKEEGIIMSDTPMEIRTNREFIRAAHGKVLIAGLGLGLVLLSIQGKEEVESITVIELFPELVDMVTSRIPLNKKVKIVNGNIFKWLPADGEKFDTIYFDIWAEISGDNYPETKELHKRFRKYLNSKENPHAWMNSWRREDFRRKYFENKAYDEVMQRFHGPKVIPGIEEMKKELNKGGIK